MASPPVDAPEELDPADEEEELDVPPEDGAGAAESAESAAAGVSVEALPLVPAPSVTPASVTPPEVSIPPGACPREPQEGDELSELRLELESLCSLPPRPMSTIKWSKRLSWASCCSVLCLPSSSSLSRRSSSSIAYDAHRSILTPLGERQLNHRLAEALKWPAHWREFHRLHR